jgi:hypothetical protein
MNRDGGSAALRVPPGVAFWSLWERKRRIKHPGFFATMGINAINRGHGAGYERLARRLVRAAGAGER